MKKCGNCHKPIELNTKELPRKFDWWAFKWLTFHNRNCKREWRHKRAEDNRRKRAVHLLFHPP